MTKSFLLIIWVCLLAFVVANPPSQQNIIKNFKVSPETVKPGSDVHLTWERVTKKSEVLQFFIGHSTGMGHAPQKLLGKANIKNMKADVVIPNSLTPSTPGNIWIVEVMVNENGTLYDVDTVIIHVT